MPIKLYISQGMELNNVVDTCVIKLQQANAVFSYKQKLYTANKI